MRVLVLCINKPWPTCAGGTLRDWQNIVALSQIADVNVLYFHEAISRNPNLPRDIFPAFQNIHDLPIARGRSIFGILDAIRDFRMSIYTNHWSEYLWSRRLQSSLEKHIESNKYDFCLIEDQVLWRYAIGIRRICPIVVDFHNVQSDIEFQNSRSIPIWHLWERWQGLQAERLMRLAESELKNEIAFACSEIDRKRLIRNGMDPRKVHVLSNTVDCTDSSVCSDVLGLSTQSSHAPRILFSGALNYMPNVKAVEYLAKFTLPAVKMNSPRSKLIVVGKEPHKRVSSSAAKHPDIELYRDVPDTAPYFRRATVMSVPLTQGGGTRFKILEAFKFGVPVITTKKGCEGLDVVHGKHLIVEDMLERHADHIIRLSRDPEHRNSLCGNARNLLLEKYAYTSSMSQIRSAIRSFFDSSLVI